MAGAVTTPRVGGGRPQSDPLLLHEAVALRWRTALLQLGNVYGNDILTVGSTVMVAHPE